MNISEGNNSQNYLLKLLKRGQFVFYTSLIEKSIYFLIFIILARKYSTSEYGSFISVFVLSNILISLFELGFGNYFQRTAASDKYKLAEEFNSAFTFRLLTYLLILLLSFIYYSAESIDKALLVIIITAFFIFNTNWLLIKIFYGLNQYRSVFIKFLISRFILIVCSIILLYVNASLTFFSLSYFISALSEFVLLFLQTIRLKLFKFNLDLNFDVLKRIFFSSIPMGLGMFFVMIYDRVDVLLIQKIIDDTAVGIYSVAYSLYKIPQIFILIILTPLFTDLSNEFGFNGKIKFQRIQKLGLTFILFSIISIIIFFFLSESMIGLIYGDKYLSSAPILKLIVLSLPFLLLNNLTGVTLNSIGKEKFVFYSTLAAALINLTLNLFLLITVGLFGAIVSTILTELLVFMIQLYYIIKFKSAVII